MKKKISNGPRFSFTSYLLGTTAVFFLAIAFAIGLLVSYRYSQTMWSRQLDNTLSSLSVSADQMGQILNGAKLTAAAARADTKVDQYLYGDFSSDVERVYAMRQAMNRMLRSISETPMIQGLFFAKSDGTLCGYNSNNLFLTGDEPHPLWNDERFARAVSFRGVTWLAPYQLGDLELDGRAEICMENVLVFGMINESYTLSSDPEIHTLVTLAAVDNAQLLSCFDYLCEEDDELFLVNERGECIYAVGAAWVNGVVDCWTGVDPADEGGYRQWNDAGESGRYVVYHRIPKTGWYLIKTTSAKIFRQDLDRLHRDVLRIAIGMLIVTGSFYALWSRRTNLSLGLIDRAMERMRGGDLSARIDKPMSIKEYEAIRRQFNSMADSIIDLLEETRHMERERVTLEARVLQTQLSPHMIFNSIAAIRWMATVLGVEQISEMLGALAELLQPVFREWHLSWTLREELAHLSNYETLLKLRYGDAISISISVPEELMGYELPCFVLQPILENCFEHGAHLSDVLSVSLGARVEGDKLVIFVRDNGGGIDPDTLEKLRARMARADDAAAGVGGIGLYNAHRKLRLLCGKDSGLEISSEPGIGTTVMLVVSANVKK